MLSEKYTKTLVISMVLHGLGLRLALMVLLTQTNTRTKTKVAVARSRPRLILWYFVRPRPMQNHPCKTKTNSKTWICSSLMFYYIFHLSYLQFKYWIIYKYTNSIGIFWNYKITILNNRINRKALKSTSTIYLYTHTFLKSHSN